METETLDKLYLEWSQVTNARTKREIESGALVEQLTHELGEMTKTMDKAGDMLERAMGELRSTRAAVEAFLQEWAWMDGPEGWRESVQKLRDEILPQNSNSTR